MVDLYQYTYDVSILQVWRKTPHRSWQTYLAQNHQLEQEACLRGKNDILVTHDCLTAAQLFPHHLLVPGWSPHHLLQPATRTVPERETKGWWPTSFHVDHTSSTGQAYPGKRACHFLLRTSQCPPCPLARAAAGRTTEATPRSHAPNVDVAGRAGETHSAPGTTAAFCSPIDLF